MREMSDLGEERWTEAVSERKTAEKELNNYLNDDGALSREEFKERSQSILPSDHVGGTMIIKLPGITLKDMLAVIQLPKIKQNFRGGVMEYVLKEI